MGKICGTGITEDLVKKGLNNIRKIMHVVLFWSVITTIESQTKRKQVLPHLSLQFKSQTN